MLTRSRPLCLILQTVNGSLDEGEVVDERVSEVDQSQEVYTILIEYLVGWWSTGEHMGGAFLYI